MKKGFKIFLCQFQALSKNSKYGQLSGVTNNVDDQYIVHTKQFSLNKIFDASNINSITPISTQTCYRWMSHLGYRNLLPLFKIINGTELKDFIPAEICLECIKIKKQQKLSNENRSKSSEYLDDLHHYLGGPSPITEKDH